MKIFIKIIALLALTNLAHGEIKTQAIEYQVDEQSFTGYLAYDDSLSGKRPGVLVVHEWWGVSDYEKKRARMLAELGYVAFVVDMYGTGKLTDNPEQAKAWMQEVTTDVEWWRERAQPGIRQLQKHPMVDGQNIAAIGYCFGGGTVLQLAYGGADLKGVVSFHGSLPIAGQDAFGKIKARLLIAHGNADGFVPRDIVNKFQLTLDKADANWEMITYGKVRHSFTNPKADTRGIAALKYDSYADQHSWQAMQTFLNTIFTSQP
ncbi:MAG: dienelactone hydrolase family protein [Gammaproteobacteria bacterium]|nr:dienelactone hydrolase family protein [Gammaproteobacteria bacterium]